MNSELNDDRNVVEELLRSAKEHFLTYGYDKASLRKICAGAGVTTGALYFSFKNKEDLFDALVRPTLEKMDYVLDNLEELVMKQDGKHFDEEKFDEFIFRFLIENREGIRLLMARSEGSQYEDFSRKIHAHVEKLMAHYARSIGGVEVSDALIAILTNMYFTAVTDLICGDYGAEQTEELSNALRACMETGFQAMLTRLKAGG